MKEIREEKESKRLCRIWERVKKRLSGIWECLGELTSVQFARKSGGIRREWDSRGKRKMGEKRTE